MRSGRFSRRRAHAAHAAFWTSSVSLAVAISSVDGVALPQADALVAELGTRLIAWRRGNSLARLTIVTTAARTNSSELATVLRPALLRLTRLIRIQRVDTSITLTQLSALGALEKTGPMTPGELAAYERVQPPSMTKVLSSLEERGLVQRTTHPTDRRQAIIELTDAAHDLIESERRSRDAWFSQRLATLSDEERALLRNVGPGARQAGRTSDGTGRPLEAESPQHPTDTRTAPTGDVPVASGTQLPPVRHRAGDLADRHLDAASRAGLARARTDELRHGTRHRDGAAVRASARPRTLGWRARRPRRQAPAAARRPSRGSPSSP